MRRSVVCSLLFLLGFCLCCFVNGFLFTERKNSGTWALYGSRRRGFGSAPKVSKDTKKTQDPAIFIKRVSQAIKTAFPSIKEQLLENGWFVQDKLLGASDQNSLRGEAESLRVSGMMVPSQSTKWDDNAQSVIYYEKYNVLSTQLLGGDSYSSAPRLTEYTVALTQTLAPLISENFPEVTLDNGVQTNKLAVCLGDGSSYDKHIDNQGAGDRRKLTVLYYMNPDWKPEHGGEFRIFHPHNDTIFSDITPVGDRLFGFWSDKLVHSVQPSFAPEGPKSYRFALTVWLCATSDDQIQFDNQSENVHFSSLRCGAG